MISESETFIEQFDQLGEDKTQLLEELILVQAGDIGKLDVNEVMLRYFENRQRLGGDTWDNDNQALRQLFSASSRLPRVRHFPGSAGRLVGRPALPASGARRRDHATWRQQPQPLTTTLSKDRREALDGGVGGGQKKSKRPLEEERLAEHLISAADTYEGIERELAVLAEQLVARSLSQAVYNSAVHQLAVRLVRRALDRASDHLSDRSSSSRATSSAADKTSNEREARIDAIAQELARSQEGRGDPRELTFASERAESVAEGLLEQVMADAAQVVSGQD